LFADLGARILVGDVRAGAVVTWVSGLDGDGVVGQLTISQHPCHRTWHGHSPSFAELCAQILVGVIWAGAVETWVIGLDGDGVVGQLTISQRPCHRVWHGRRPSFAVPGLSLLAPFG